MRLLLAALVALVSGCATTDMDGFRQPPTLTNVCVSVQWQTDEQIRVRCGADKLACGSVGSERLPNTFIAAEKPTGWYDHARIYTLGHEFLHSLGANH